MSAGIRVGAFFFSYNKKKTKKVSRIGRYFISLHLENCIKMNTENNTTPKETTSKGEKEKKERKPVVVPYVPGLYCKYLVPDPFGTGR